MLSVSNLSVQFGKRILFDEVSTSFNQGNCYGIIGANGAGKSTFLKILAGKQEPTSGQVHLEPGKRMSVLEQNHNLYDEHTVLETVIMGNKPLFKIKTEIDALYADYTDENAEKIGELQVEFEEMNGWNADSDAASLLSNLGISEDSHYSLMKDLDGKQKVRVLLAQALFGNPDVLIMDEPTNDLDYETISWLENFLANYDNCVIVVSHDRHFLDGPLYGGFVDQFVALRDRHLRVCIVIQSNRFTSVGQLPHCAQKENHSSGARRGRECKQLLSIDRFGGQFNQPVIFVH